MSRKHRCPHGLDLRKYPRCYLCEPDFEFPVPAVALEGCTCPPVWHGIIPPYCPVHNPGSGATNPSPIIGPNTWGDFTVRCTCPPDRGDNYRGSCPIHDVWVTYTYTTRNLLT